MFLQESQGSQVAIKVMDKEALRKTVSVSTLDNFFLKKIFANASQNDLQRVALEIQALRELSHQNIAKLYEVDSISMSNALLLLTLAAGGGDG